MALINTGQEDVDLHCDGIFALRTKEKVREVPGGCKTYLSHIVSIT